MVKHLLLIMFLVIGCLTPVCAQKEGKHDRDKMMKEIREYKIKFLAQEMELEGEQKASFAELYNEMSEKRKECMRDAMKMERALKKNKDASEAEYQAVTDAMTKAKAEDAAIEKQYDEKFSKFLTQKQIFKMKEAENEFRKKMSELRHKKK